jgi:hypothetical protein
MRAKLGWPASPRAIAKNFFTLFVDAIFTTLLEALFTNALQVIASKRPRGCVCRSGHAD